jgi:short-subunit dehydrogenase
MGANGTALVTGASGGIGRELARRYAADGYDLVLVARSGVRLEELAQELEERHRIATTVLPRDLSVPGSALELADEVAGRGLQIDALVNSAGFTQFGPCGGAAEGEMVGVRGVNNVGRTPHTRRHQPGMLERGRGQIVNLSSNAAFQPGPQMAVYYASKAFVLHLSLALVEEVRGTGVTVTALCPGPTRSGFQARAAMEDSRLVKDRDIPDAAEVAEWGYAQVKAGRPFAVQGLRNRAFAFGTRLLPRSTAARIVAHAQRRASG